MYGWKSSVLILNSVLAVLPVGASINCTKTSYSVLKTSIFKNEFSLNFHLKDEGERTHK